MGICMMPRFGLDLSFFHVHVAQSLDLTHEHQGVAHAVPLVPDLVNSNAFLSAISANVAIHIDMQHVAGASWVFADPPWCGTTT